MSVELARNQLPTIRRQDISWRSVGALVEIQIVLTNESDEPTEAAQLVIEAAAFGAFVPNKPIARIAVAGFDPRERRTIMTRVPRFRLDALSRAHLRSDALPSREWVGNLNVYFDDRPEGAVELHRAFDLKVRAGSQALFHFFVGLDDPSTVLAQDPFSFDVTSSDPRWSTEVETRSLIAVLTVYVPSEVGLRSTIEVRVSRKSAGKTVPVEFTLETVCRPSDTIGCVPA